MDLTELLAFVVKNKASDLHLSSGLPPMIRVHGDIRRINVPALEHKDVHGMVYDIMNDGQRKFYEENLECDFSFAVPNLARFRVNAFVQQRGAAAVLRTIPSKVLTLDELKCPKIFVEIADQPRGIVLVTGPTGSGKSTTLAAMINHINETEQGHILTIEDPIEFVHESKKSLINQREVGPHTLSFSNALRSALREDPDVILVGEMRDLETIRLALTGAETGHLVFGTLHTSSAAMRPRPSAVGTRFCVTIPCKVPASCIRTWSCCSAGKTSMMRSIVCGALWVCSVAKTRCPVSAAVSAVAIVSRSRISPTRTTSGS